MGNKKDGQSPFLLEAAYEFVEPLLTGLIDPRRWFIEQKDVGIADQRESDEQTLKLSSGHGPNRMLGDFKRDANQTQ